MSRFSRHAAAWLALAVLALPCAARAEDPVPGPWKYGAVTALNLSQSAYSSNWKGGDHGALVWVLNADLTAERQFNDVFHLGNQLQLAYGQTARQDTTASGLRWDRPEKSTDLIAFESVGRFSLHSYVEPYMAFRIESQFLDQSSDIGDIKFNPIKLKESAGIARVLAKRDDAEATTRLGFGLRQTFAKSFVSSVTMETERFVTTDGGFEWQTQTTWPLFGDKVLYKGNLLVFQPLFYSGKNDLEAFDTEALANPTDPISESVKDFWKATDVTFQNNFNAKITEYLSVNLLVEWGYDKFDAAANVGFAADPTKNYADRKAEILRNVRKAGQFKQVLSIGLSYRLF